MKKRTTVVGIFNDHVATIDAINELRQLGFSDDQLGFVVRSDTDRENSIGGHDANGIALGIVSGLLGAADVLLLPITRSDVKGDLPTTQKAIDRLPPLSSHKKMPSQALPPTVSSVEPPLQPEQDLGREGAAMTIESGKPNGPGKHSTSVITGGVIGGTLGAIASLYLPDTGPVIAGGALASILGSAAPGGIVGGFLSMGIPEQKAHYYEQQFQTGNIVFTVKADGEQQEAHNILRHHGALDIEAH